ncbi:MAG: multiheme c-type cytochrome, partial [Thiotrichales bacterium]
MVRQRDRRRAPLPVRASFFMVSLVFALGVGVWGTVHADPGRVTGSVPTAPHEVSSKVCGECHQEIYDEWKGSMHAQSTALTDPIHGAFYRSEVGDPTQEGQTMKDGKFPVCLGCHAP